MDRLAIESLTVFAMPPIEFVHLAADLDCPRISIGLAPFSENPENYPAWSLREDSAHRAMKAALRERGVAIVLGQGFAIFPDRDIRDRTGDLDLMLELGVRRFSSVSLDPDLARTLDQIAAFAEMTEAAGAEIAIEFVPRHAINTLFAAVSAVRYIGRNNARIMIDSMHLIRSGGSAADVAAIDPNLIGYAQLCDAPLRPTIRDYSQEVVTERLAPGAGELPLRDILLALPNNVVIGLEVPMLARALAGEGAHQRADDCLKRAREILASLPCVG